MTFIFLLLAGALLVAAVILLGRASDNAHWRDTLVAYRLQLPANLSVADVTKWLGMVAAATHPRAWSLAPLPPLGLEVVATRSGIAHYLLVPRDSHVRLLATLRAGLPGARFEEAPSYLLDGFEPTTAGEVGMTSRRRPLAWDHAESTSHALLSTLQPLNGQEEVHISLALTSAGTPKPLHSASPNVEDRWWATYLVEGEASPDADAVRAARLKQSEPLLQAVLRVGTVAASVGRSRSLFGQTWSALHGMNAQGVRLVRRWLPSPVVADRMTKRALPVAIYPLLLNTRELAGLLAFPFSSMSFPGLKVGASRQLPPTTNTPTHGTVLATSTFPGKPRPLALRADDRRRHLYVLGPTGSGKSTLLSNVALQDISQGLGVALIDPKGDLVDDVLTRIPEHRREEVVVLDPASVDYPVGFNLLGSLHNEAARELAADHVVHIMSSIWKDSWGPRSNDLVRSAVLTLASTHAPDGSAFSLVEVPELLTNASFRRYVTGQKTVPETLRPFWYSFENMSDGERASAAAQKVGEVMASGPAD